jgi:uncharacterized membrane protein
MEIQFVFCERVSGYLNVRSAEINFRLSRLMWNLPVNVLIAIPANMTQFFVVIAASKFCTTVF